MCTEKIKPSDEVTCALLKINIRAALNDYFKRTHDTDILDDVSDEFVNRLAKDATVSKRNLRNLFRKSPNWDENLQALVLSGTRPNVPDAAKINSINSLANKILQPILDKIPDLMLHEEAEEYAKIQTAINYFSGKLKDEAKAESAINALVPKAYKRGKKKSRIFKALCDGLGITNNAAGSEFQKNFTLLSEELSEKPQNFKLYVSINPAHFMTMSNPYSDKRGSTVVSCHSLNSGSQYNNGCAGYARDEVTMIAFTVANADKTENFNNRKTSRQLFFYQVGGGVLLQSRLYSSHSGESYGGMDGYQPESEVYRKMIEKELAALENASDVWQVSDYVTSNIRIDKSRHFGGYPDWIHKKFAPKISVRADHAANYIDDGTNASIKRPFIIGNSGLCIKCGEEIFSGLYCLENEGCNKYCYHCESHDNLRLMAYGNANNLVYVCDECFNKYYRQCEICGEYRHVSELRENDDGRQICRECWKNEHPRCVSCGERFNRNDMIQLANGEMVCRDCVSYCEDCGKPCYVNRRYNVYDAECCTRIVCDTCLNEHYVRCVHCEDYYPRDTTMHNLAYGGKICNDCYINFNYCHCDDCDEIYNADDLYFAHDEDGNECYVCESCLSHYNRCVECDEYYHEHTTHQLESGGAICEHCLENGDYSYCEHCEGLYHYDDLRCAYDENGDSVNVCCGCLEYHYELCAECDEWYYRDEMYERDDGEYVCRHCYDVHYDHCGNCGGVYHVNEMQTVSDANGSEYCICENCASNCEPQEVV